jgi:RNA polymerase sigma factor (sigma-70 family)
MNDDASPVPLDRLLAHREWVRRVARAMVRDENDADDLEQGIWLEALQRTPRVRRSIRGWLFTALRRDATDARRSDGSRAHREALQAKAEAVPSAEELVAKADADKRVVVAVMDLEEPYRATVLYRYFEDLSPAAIAARQGVPVETVRTRLKRALAQLRARLDREYGGDGKAWGLALAPLLWKSGGVAVKASTKVGLVVAAAVLVAAGVRTWTWTPPQRTEAKRYVSTATAPTPPRLASTPTRKDADAGAVFGEVWMRGPEKPVPGVDVRLTSEGSPTRVARADATGKFRFDGLPVGTRGAVRVATDGRATEPVAVPPLLSGESRFVGVMWLAPATSLDVVVTSLSGAPIEGARVAAHERPDFAVQHPDRALGTVWFDPEVFSGTWRDARDPASSATTDAAGRATLVGLVPGAGQLVAAKDGFARTARIETITPDPNAAAHLVLAPGVSLIGSVEDRSGRPVPGLALFAYAGEALLPNFVEATPRAVTDAGGRFALTGLDEGKSVVWAARQGSSPVQVAEFRVPADAPVRIVLGGARVIGTVREAAGGQAVVGARVRAYVGGGHGVAWADAVTDAAGGYEIPLFASRGYVNDVRVDGWSLVEEPRWDAHGTFEIRDDAETRIDLTVRRVSGLRGRVTHGGSPVRGALVGATGHAKSGRWITTASTDGEGRYEIPGVTGVVVVKVDAPPFVQTGYPYDDVTQFVLRGTRPPRGSVDVPPEGAAFDVDLVDGADLAGRVVDAGDGPVEGAQVIAGAANATSATDGTFVLHGVDLAATNTIWARKAGFVEPAGASPSPPVTIRLTPCPVVRGIVVATDGALVDGWVEWTRKPERQMTSAQTPPVEWSAERRVAVDTDGAFEATITFWSNALLFRAGGRGHGPSAPVEVVATPGTSAPTVRIEVAPTAAVRGRVVADDGSAVAGAAVEIDRETNRSPWNEDGRWSTGVVAARSGADGGFEISALPPGAHRVLVLADGFLPGTTEIDASAARDVDVRLARASYVRGVLVTSDGRAVGDASVSFFPSGAPEDWTGAYFGGVVKSDGAFRSTALPPGAYVVVVTQGSSRLVFERARFPDIVAGTSDARLVLDVSSEISGRVVGGDGAPIAKAELWLTVEGGRSGTTARTGDDGRFEIIVSGDGPYALVARPPAATSILRGTLDLDKRYLRAVMRDVAAGTKGLDVVLPVGEEIEGVLVDASGAPAAQRWIVVEPLVTPKIDGLIGDGERPGARTGADGRFVVTGLAPGGYRLLEFTMTPWRKTPLAGGESVAAGARGVRLAMPGTAAISGRVVDETGAPFAGVAVVARDAGGAAFPSGTAADGTFKIEGVPGFGVYTVEAKVNQRAPMRAVDVAPGATGVTIRLVRGLPVRGRLVDAAGKPVATATLVFRKEHGDIEATAHTDADGRFAVENLLSGTFRVEQMTSRGGAFVYVPCGTIRAGDDGVELRRSE